MGTIERGIPNHRAPRLPPIAIFRALRRNTAELAPPVFMVPGLPRFARALASPNNRGAISVSSAPRVSGALWSAAFWSGAGLYDILFHRPRLARGHSWPRHALAPRGIRKSLWPVLFARNRPGPARSSSAAMQFRLQPGFASCGWHPFRLAFNCSTPPQATPTRARRKAAVSP